MTIDLNDHEAVLLDLDGTVYHGDRPLPGAVQFIRRLLDERRKFACLSNTTSSPARIAARLAKMGVELEPEQIFTAAASACDYVMHRFGNDRPPRVFNLATEGVAQMLEGKVEWVSSGGEPCDAIIVGTPANRFATPDRQRVALELARKGAMVLGTSADRVYPSVRGLEFGAGALSWMLAYAAAVEPVFCGKPQEIFFRTLCQRLGVEPEQCLLIGDNLEADIAGAQALKMTTVLVLTGVTRRRDLMRAAPERRPDHVIEDLNELMAHPA